MFHIIPTAHDKEDILPEGAIRGGFSPDLSDTWSYDLAADSWTLLMENSPPGRRYAMGTYRLLTKPATA